MTRGSQCIAGCLFRYAHAKHESVETLDMAKRVACTVAEGAAINSGNNYVVARTIKPVGYIVFAAGHPGLNSINNVPAYEITPESACIRLEH